MDNAGASFIRQTRIGCKPPTFHDVGVSGTPIRGPDERAPDGGCREGADRVDGFEIGQGVAGQCAQRDRARAAALAGEDDQCLRRSVPVLGAIAHQFAGPHPGERKHTAPHLGGGPSGTGLPLGRGPALVGHRCKNAADGVVGEPTHLRGRIPERRNVPYGIQGIPTVERHVQREERLTVVVACGRCVGPPQVGESGSHVSRGDGVSAAVSEAGRPPIQLLPALRHETRPIGDLSQEGFDVGSKRPRGLPGQFQPDAGIEAPPPNRVQRRAYRKALESQVTVGTDIGVDPAVGVTPDAGFTMRSHGRQGTPGCPLPNTRPGRARSAHRRP